ncbi:inactive histone-lysine N-methyltransferase 2E [Oncorhynchus keta]|uniref:inactive histone-lysine N-methyltransferase 2E n=1 Tax=Oncorhynchus keta TaxID=8018 RepID=UPI00227B0ADD|nr:inactive histone-lysine N-methyltransferase 2E [Oncorhynchus keta]
MREESKVCRFPDYVMNLHLLPVVLSLAVIISVTLSQDLVSIQFKSDPVLVQTGTDAVFTVVTVSQVFSITWGYPGGVTPLGLWVGGSAVLNTVTQYQGRVTITATQLRISSTQLGDAGNYTVQVDPSPTTGLAQNSRSIQLRVFDAVDGVTMFVPSVALEGGNVSVRCTWTKGTETSVMWGKGGSVLTSNSRVTIKGGDLVINPARREDAGVYSCTVANLVSAQTASKTLTVYYGPDTPVLSNDSPVDCVGGADAVLGQTIRLTCASDSLPPATFSWQYNNEPVASGQPDSGVFSLQTFSTNQSGQYKCVARNAITGATSEQGTGLAIVGTCLSAGAVAGIVIGCVVALILIIMAIVLLVRWRKVDRRPEATGQKGHPDLMLTPPEPPPPGTRTLGGQHSVPPDGRENTHTPPRDTNTLQHNGHANSKGFPHNAQHQNANSFPRNATTQEHNTFTRTAAPQNANTLDTLPQMTQNHPNNPNILIQAGSTQVGVNLNTPPHNQQNSNAQLPTVHVNLNSYPTNGQHPNQQSQQQFTSPQDSTMQWSAINVANSVSAPQVQNNNPQTVTQTGQSYSNPRMQLGVSYPGGPSQVDHSNLDTGPQVSTGPVPTGYTHGGRSHTLQRNANTQACQRDQATDTQPRHSNPAAASSVPRDASHATPSASSHHQQMPWDRLMGTPAYPNNSPRRVQASPDSSYTSDSTESPSPARRFQPHTRRSGPGAQTQSPPQSRSAPRKAAPAADRQAQNLPHTHGTNNQPGAPSHTQSHISSHVRDTPRQRARQDVRAQSQITAQTASQSQTGPRQQNASHSHHNPQPQQQGPGAPQGLITNMPRGTTLNTQALTNPNHIPQTQIGIQYGRGNTHMLPQPTQDQRQAATQGWGAISQPVTQNPSSLTQTALEMHTLTTPNPFHNRNHQTQAALLNTQARGPNLGRQRPPTPPPVIPLAQFQTIPRERTQHQSPNRGPDGPLRPPVNIHTTQRHPSAHPPHRHIDATMPANLHSGNGHHVHADNTHRHGQGTQHAHRNPAHPRQTHQGRPRH